MASKLTKKINSQFNPTLLSGYPVYAYGGKMYAFGSWLKSNAGNIAQTALGAGAMTIPGFQGVGSSLLSSGIGGMATTGDTIGNQQEAQAQAQQSALKKEMISNLPAQHYYTPTFAMGGKFKPGSFPFLQPKDSEGNRRYLLQEWAQNRNNPPIEFGSGKFGGAGAGSTFGNNYQIPVEWTDTRIPIEGDSFNDAFRKARKAGKKEFTFNDKKFNTDLGPDSTYNPNKGNIREQLRLRMLYDENNKIIQDSTRFEPELGQPIVNTIDKGMRDTGSFKYGGKISPSEIAKGTKEEMEHTSSKKVSRKTAMDHLKEDPKYYTKLKKAGLADSYAGGGMLNSYANGGNITKRLSEVNSGTTHEQSPIGGVPITQGALVEDGEFLYTTKDGQKYVFSNRF